MAENDSMSLSELLKTLNDHGKLSDVAPEPSLQIGAVPPTQEQMAPHSLPQDRQEIPPLQPAPVQVSRQAVQEREVDAEWRNDLIQFFPPNRAAEEERVPAVQPSVHLSVGEVEELKHRVHSLEKENNELKRQLSRMSQHYRTPPPNEQAAPVLMMRTPGSDRVGTPTTPAAMAALSATAPSFIPITSPNGFVTSNISPVYNNMTPSPQGTPTAIMGLSPTQGTPTSSPGPKCVVTNNVCRHWMANRCTYGNDCRFAHPPNGQATGEPGLVSLSSTPAPGQLSPNKVASGMVMKSVSGEVLQGSSVGRPIGQVSVAHRQLAAGGFEDQSTMFREANSIHHLGYAASTTA